jgi:DNA-binding PadR family transcriptional regulator
MPRTNQTEYALLGLLADAPATGYDLRKLVDQRLSHFWHESLGHIYPILARLAGKGWVRRRVKPGKRRLARHEYEITADGLAALEAWFWEPAEPVPPRNDLLLKVFLGRRAPPGALAEHVAAYRAQRAQDLAMLMEISRLLAKEAADSPDYPHWDMTLRAGIHAAKAALSWCDETLSRLD